MDDSAVQIIIALLGGGLITAATGWMKMRAEVEKTKSDAGKTLMEQAEGAVVVQGKVIEGLRDEIARIRLDNEQCRRQEMDLREQVHGQMARMQVLTDRIDELEDWVRRLGGNPERKGPGQI
jgi:hypothetical protein